MMRTQDHALSQTSPMMEVIEMWITSNPDQASQWLPFSEVSNQIRTMARIRRMPGPFRTARQVYLHIDSLRHSLVETYGMEESDEGGEKRIRFNGIAVHTNGDSPESSVSITVERTR